jgi:hypothetical protein
MTQKRLREEQYKVKICAVRPDLMSRIEQLEAQVDQRDRDIAILKQEKLELRMMLSTTTKSLKVSE